MAVSKRFKDIVKELYTERMEKPVRIIFINGDLCFFKEG